MKINFLSPYNFKWQWLKIKQLFWCVVGMVIGQAFHSLGQKSVHYKNSSKKVLDLSSK